MANIHKEFQLFKKRISLSSSRNKRLRSSKDKLITEIKKHFRSNSNLSNPEFFIQGSYKMKTIIRKADNTYDLDMGVYFKNNQGLEPITLQQNVIRAIEKITNTPPKHLNKCVRVIYQNDYNIDLPVFWKDEITGENMLATKNGWKSDDAKEMGIWFRSMVDKRGQLKRLIRYTKFWASQQRSKMPSGIAFTIWLANNFVKHSRDEMALRNTLKKLYLELANNLECQNPVNESEDFVSYLTDLQKEKFINALRSLIVSLNASIRCRNQIQAISKMNLAFGGKFN